MDDRRVSKKPPGSRARRRAALGVLAAVASLAATAPAAQWPDADQRLGINAELTIAVSAEPSQAAERLGQILKRSGLALKLRLLCPPPAARMCREEVLRPDEIRVNDSPRCTFTALRFGSYRVEVAIGDGTGGYRKTSPEFQLRESGQVVTFSIPFRELSVEAEPSFGLYVMDHRSRQRAERGAKRSSDDLVAFSGSSKVGGSRFLLCAGPKSVRFFFWDLPLISAVLTASPREDSETAPIEITSSSLTRRLTVAEPDERLSGSPFRAVTFDPAKDTGCLP